jgi:hypothetical protein
VERNRGRNGIPAALISHCHRDWRKAVGIKLQRTRSQRSDGYNSLNFPGQQSLRSLNSIYSDLQALDAPDG